MSFRLSLVGISLVAVVAGCNNSDRQPVYPVRGTIRLEGNAMPGGGSIAFIPIEKQKGKTAGGEIRENGTYELTTYSGGDGSMVGYFRVVIVQSTSMEPREAIPDGQPIPEGGMQGIAVSQGDHIPAAYGDPGKSPLRATVEPTSNVLNFDLQRTLDVGPGQGANPPGVAARFEQPILIVARSKGSRDQRALLGRHQ
ncbi:MAG: hypothetical protein JWP89_1568 [Schlesneria sp.]|nr:hypothetical protein [Schlesneria sp.]